MENNLKRKFVSEVIYKFQKGEINIAEVKKIMILIKENKENILITEVLKTILKG